MVTDLNEHMIALAARMREVAQELRESAEAADKNGQACKASRRYTHADELDGAARLMEDWARELGRERFQGADGAGEAPPAITQPANSEEPSA